MRVTEVNLIPGEVIWLSSGPSARTTMTGLTQRLPTRKHCQRAAIFHHSPSDMWVRSSGLCTKWDPLDCYHRRSLGDWGEWGEEGKWCRSFTPKLCGRISNIRGVKQSEDKVHCSSQLIPQKICTHLCRGCNDRSGHVIIPLRPGCHAFHQSS